MRRDLNPAKTSEEVDREALDMIRSGRWDAWRFRFLRRYLGESCKGLAKLLMRTPETVSRWEHGRYPLHPLAWFALCMLVSDRLRAKGLTVPDARTVLEEMVKPEA